MEKSALGRLPPEVRNNIYERVLSTERDFRVFSCDGVHPDTGEQESGRKGLTLYYEDKLDAKAALDFTATCKEIRSETLIMFYALNGFTLIYASSSHAVGTWSPQMKETYVAALTAVRRWLKKLPKRASSAVKLQIMHDGGATYLPGKRLTYWWNNARAAEKDILHKHLKPANIRITVQLKCLEILRDRFNRRLHNGMILPTCHLDIIVNEASVLVLNLPTVDKKEARVVIEAASDAKIAVIEGYAKSHGCCVGTLKNDLVQGVEDGRKLMLQTLGK